MASTARWGLKYRFVLAAAVSRSCRNGLYSPLGIEIHQTSAARELAYSCRNGLYSPLGIEIMLMCSRWLHYQQGRNGLYSPLGIEILQGTQRRTRLGASEWPLQPV